MEIFKLIVAFFCIILIAGLLAEVNTIVLALYLSCAFSIFAYLLYYRKFYSPWNLVGPCLLFTATLLYFYWEHQAVPIILMVLTFLILMFAPEKLK